MISINPETAKATATKLKAIGLSDSYAWQIANGQRTPGFALGLRIEAALGIAPSHWAAVKAAYRPKQPRKARA